MPDAVNPYTPGRPVEGDLFFGRRDLLSSLREQLVKGRRVFVVAGARRMGKTSFLRQVPAHLPEGCAPVLVSLEEEETERLDWLLWRLADILGLQVGLLTGLDVPAPQWADMADRPDYLLDHYWPLLRAALGGRCLVLLLDDLDALAGRVEGLLDSFVATLSAWRDRDAGVALALTTSLTVQERLIRDHQRLFGGAQVYTLGPLSSEEAARLITWPVESLLTFDYGVPRRLIEITSGQPYYLQLVCHELFGRCAAGGWVNQRDVDLVLEELVGREIADFRRVWDESTPQEKAVLAALTSLRGARGVATVQEAHTVLSKLHSRLRRDQVAEALESLSLRGVLERLGALSYRFRVSLLRDWLIRRFDPEQVIREARWSTAQRAAATREREERARPRSRAKPKRPARAGQAPPPPPAEEEGEAAAPVRRRRLRPWLAVSVLALAGIVAGGAWLLRPPAVTPAAAASSTAGPTAVSAVTTTVPAVVNTALPTAAETAVPATATAPRPTPTRTRTPLPTPTPTVPIVVTRPVAAIAYQSKAEGEKAWSVFVMASDGTHQTRVAGGQTGFLSPPTWSPDGKSLAYAADVGGVVDIWASPVEGGEPVNLTRDEAKDHSPAWSPDGQWIAFASVRDAPYWELYTMRPDGSEVQRLTWWEDASDLSPSWSPDGTRLAFASKRDGNWEIYLMSRDGSNLVRLTDDAADDTAPAWSPDGSRIAFESARDGFGEVYVVPVAGGQAVNLTKLSWATDLGPTWSPDGGRIAFYSDRENGWAIYVMGSDGSNVTRLTGSTGSDQVPAWRP